MNRREGFEAAWAKEYPLHSRTAFTRSGFDAERYANTRVQDGWLMWNAADERTAELERMLSGERGLKELWKERASVWCLAANERAASADEIFVTLCDLLGQVQAFIDQYGEADFETGRAKQTIANRNGLLASTGGNKS